MALLQSLMVMHQDDEEPLSSRPTMMPPKPPPTIPPPGEYDLLIASTFKKPSPYQGLAADVATILAEIATAENLPMNPKEAVEFNKKFPFTVSACDNNRSFPSESFATRELAENYAANQGGRPWVICASDSGAVLDSYYV